MFCTSATCIHRSASSLHLVDRTTCTTEPQQWINNVNATVSTVAGTRTVVLPNGRYSTEGYAGPRENAPQWLQDAAAPARECLV